MYHNIEITNLKERKIIYKSARKIRLRNLSLMVCILVIPLSLMLGFSLTNYGSLKDTIAVMNNPIYPPYSETGNIIFTNGQSYFIENDENLEFVSPVKSYQYSIENNTIKFTVYSNTIVNAIEEGIVIDCGTNKEGVKFIKIMHPNKIESTLLNIETIGVKVGDAVVKGKEIATVKESDNLFLKMLRNNKPVQDIKINNNVIIWEN